MNMYTHREEQCSKSSSHGIPELCPIKFNGRNGGHGTCKINYAVLFPPLSLLPSDHCVLMLQ